MWVWVNLISRKNKRISLSLGPLRTHRFWSLPGCERGRAGKRVQLHASYSSQIETFGSALFRPCAPYSMRSFWVFLFLGGAFNKSNRFAKNSTVSHSGHLHQFDCRLRQNSKNYETQWKYHENNKTSRNTKICLVWQFSPFWPYLCYFWLTRLYFEYFSTVAPTCAAIEFFGIRRHS